MKIFITIFAVCIATLCAKGQQFSPGKFTAKVTDDLNEPLAGVTIRVAGKNSGAVTDLDGNFTINACENDVIQCSYIGFETAEYLVYEIVLGMNNKVVLNSGCMLNEVIITATRPPLIRQDQGRGCGGYGNHASADSLQISFDKTWVFYPNPTVEGVTVETPESTGNILVFALDGALVGQTLVSRPLTKVDMLSLPAATYFLFYENKDWSSPVGKVVLNKL